MGFGVIEASRPVKATNKVQAVNIGSQKMGFGKYADETIDDILDTDNKYMDFLANKYAFKTYDVYIYVCRRVSLRPISEVNYTAIRRRNYLKYKNQSS